MMDAKIIDALDRARSLDKKTNLEAMEIFLSTLEKAGLAEKAYLIFDDASVASYVYPYDIEVLIEVYDDGDIFVSRHLLDDGKGCPTLFIKSCDSIEEATMFAIVDAGKAGASLIQPT